MIKEDLKFDLTSDSIKNFVDGLNAINEVKEIPDSNTAIDYSGVEKE